MTDIKTLDCGCEVIVATNGSVMLTYCSRHKASEDMYEALKAILLNRELGEYQSQKQGKPRMIEVNDMGRKALAKADDKV